MKNKFQKFLRNKKVIWTGIGIGAIITGLFLFYFSIYLGLWGPVPTKKQLAEIQQSEATQILDTNGKLLGKYYLFDRQSITYEEFPRYLIDALVATEDARFYEHDGIDGQSLFRVFFKTILMQDASSGGGSTITLQLAKNLYGRKDLGKIGIVVTKLRESIIAQRIESLYNKEEILTLYLNTVPFSDNTFGIESASKKFFNKSTIDLTLAEAATLIGTLKASNYFNPRLYPERSRERRDVVISQMEKYHYIHPDIAQLSKEDPLLLDYQYFHHDKGVATYFREHLRKELNKILDTLKKPNGEKYRLHHDGLVIHTTIDYTLQQYAENAMASHMEKLQEAFEKSWGSRAPWLNNQKLIDAEIKKTGLYKSLKEKGFSEERIMDSLASPTERYFFDYSNSDKRQASTLDSLKHYLKFLNAGMLSLEAETGKIKAWVGGVDFSSFQFDHVAQSKRQVGSAFKPIVYTAALENGMEPCSYFPLQETTYKGGYTPSNSSANESDDPYINYSIKYALSNSINTIAVRVMMETGIKKVVEQAGKMGIQTDLPQVPSLALGTAEISLLELAKSYSTYTNEGFYSNPHFITKIEDRQGNVIAEFNYKDSEKPAFSKETGHYMLNMMQATVNEGTATRLRTTYGLRNEIAGKTGTTQNNKDGWFVAITPKLTTITWVGHDNFNIGFRSTAQGQGANSALPIFAHYYQMMNEDPDYNGFTTVRFPSVPSDIASNMDCEESRRDGLIKRIFTNPDKPKEFKKKKKKGGIFSIFRKKDSD